MINLTPKLKWGGNDNNDGVQIFYLESHNNDYCNFLFSLLF